MTPMELLIGGNRDQKTMKAMSDGLRKRKEISQLAMLSGDDISTGFGNALSGDVERRTAQTLDDRQKSSQREMTQGYYDQMAKQSALSNTMARRRQAETERHNRETENNSRLSLSNRATQASRDVQKLSSSLVKAQIPELQAGVAKIDEELEPYLGNGSLPGVGGVSNIGPAFSTDGRAMQARVAKIRNMILKARSGGAVTPQEADRLLQEFSLGVFNTDKEFLASWQDFKDTLNAGERAIYAGFSPEVVEQYQQNFERQLDSGVEEPSGQPGAPGTSGAISWGDLD